METTITIIIAVAAAWEILARIVPTSKTKTIIGNVLKILLAISNQLDNGVKQ